VLFGVAEERAEWCCLGWRRRAAEGVGLLFRAAAEEGVYTLWLAVSDSEYAHRTQDTLVAGPKRVQGAVVAPPAARWRRRRRRCHNSVWCVGLVGPAHSRRRLRAVVCGAPRRSGAQSRAVPGVGSGARRTTGPMVGGHPPSVAPPYLAEYIELTDRRSRLRKPPETLVLFRIPSLSLRILHWFWPGL